MGRREKEKAEEENEEMDEKERKTRWRRRSMAVMNRRGEVRGKREREECVGSKR